MMMMIKLTSLLLIVVVSINKVAHCINLDKCDHLSKEQLIELDREVSQFYYDSYEKLDDEKKITYEEQLLRAIRAIRHTNVNSHFDYVYTNKEDIRESVGEQVNLERCLQQLEILNQFVKQRKSGKIIPLSAIDMLEASARPESGILNGNFIWLGSPNSCQHAKISYRHTGDDDDDDYYGSNNHSSRGDILGRYCVAHLRAKSWPKDDEYFGSRLTLKVGLCLPETCHTSLYVDSQEIRDMVEGLTKSNMVPPFDGDQYEVSYLYCMPDEDSPKRQWNLGAKLFVVFVATWLAMLLYTNIRYQRRLDAMKRLNESIDIKMIVEQQNLPQPPPPASSNQLKLPNCQDGLPSSNDVTPVPSDSDEELKQILLGKRETKRKRKRGDREERNPSESVGSFDFVRAFSIKANIDFLFRRADFLNSKLNNQQKSLSQSTLRRVSGQQQQYQATSPSIRRLSASNAAIIKDLEKESCQNGSSGKLADDELKSNPQTVEYSNMQDTNKAGGGQTAQVDKPKRVNIEVLDGIKVFATGYIIYGHTMMTFFSVVSDIRFGSERMLDFTMIGVINALQVVGLFYIITGLLIGYLAFSRQKAKQLFQPTFWIIVIIGRYLRLFPVYFLVFWFAKHVAPFTGSGPYWLEYRTDSQHPRGFCSNESWMTMLTMSAADVKIPYDCIPQSWYLSNDFRTLFIIPFYIIILAMNTTAGYAAIFSTLIYSAIRMTQVLREAHIDYNILLKWQPHVYNILADRLHSVYTNFSIRLSTYLLGVIIGHTIYLYEIGQIKRMPRWFKRFGLKIALLIGSLSFMAAPLLANKSINQFLPSPDSIDSDTMVMAIPFLKITMEICICLVLLSLITGGGFHWLRELLSSQLARVLSNISYGVFLIHVELIFKTPATKYESTWYFLFLYTTYYIVMSNIIAFAVHVLYEMPINNTIRYVFKKIFSSIVK